MQILKILGYIATGSFDMGRLRLRLRLFIRTRIGQGFRYLQVGGVRVPIPTGGIVLG